jgi:hypothetical protein
MGLPEPLLVTHRLDQCTEGVLVLGRTKRFVARFNELVSRSSSNSRNDGEDGLVAAQDEADSSSVGRSSSSASDGSVGDSQAKSEGQLNAGESSGTARAPPLRKFYRAVSASPPPLGLLRHHLSINRRQQGLPHFTIAHSEAVEGSLLAELVVREVQPIRCNS